MNDLIEVSAKSVEEAITEACVKLGLTSDQIEYEVVEKGSSGFLGIGNKPALIKAWKKREKTVSTEEVKEPVVQEEEENTTSDVVVSKEKNQNERKVTVLSDSSVEAFSVSAKEFLGKIFDAMHLEVKIETSYDKENNCLDIELSGEEMGVIIGKRGQTLDSLQYLTKLAINTNTEDKIKVKVDTEDYRNRRKKTLENLAGNVAYKVKKTGRAVELEPMNPFERRVIHSALQNNRYVKTHSEGEEPDRYVVVSPK